jgi:hypothetical protein
VDRAETIVRTCRSLLLVDWPSREVPNSLVGAGQDVFVKGGPGLDDFAIRELTDGSITTSRTGRRPRQVDLLRAPAIDELPQIVAAAQDTDAKALWYRSGLDSDGTDDPRGYWIQAAKSERARAIAEAVGLLYVDDRYIADAALQRGDRPPD